MPELPDITVYIEALQERLLDRTLDAASLRSPFLLRSASLSLDAFTGMHVSTIERMGKRIVIGFASSTSGGASTRWMVFHLMIAGRFHWRPPSRKMPGKTALIVLRFENGTLTLTEAGTKKRASLHLIDDAEALQAMDPGGLEVLDADLDTFKRAITRSNHTLKRALTDPHILSGIGNAYSDEILHAARLSPVRRTQKLSEEELECLFDATRTTLVDWVERLRTHYGDGFPEKVTAFRSDMAVHGRYDQPCPVCQSPVQRICYATNETNYCPTCQTGGRILADRSLSRLLKKDWPRTLDGLADL